MQSANPPWKRRVDARDRRVDKEASIALASLVPPGYDAGRLRPSAQRLWATSSPGLRARPHPPGSRPILPGRPSGSRKGPSRKRVRYAARPSPAYCYDLTHAVKSGVPRRSDDDLRLISLHAIRAFPALRARLTRSLHDRPRARSRGPGMIEGVALARWRSPHRADRNADAPLSAQAVYDRGWRSA